MIKIGDKVPELRGQTNQGEWVLSNHLGKQVIIYFYPKDLTPGCTQESKEFNALLNDIKNKNAVIVGISHDDLKKHQKFIDKHELNFPLIADEDKAITELFGVYQLKKFMGKEFMGIVRSTFIIDEQGVLKHEWRNVRVKGHADEVINHLS